MGSAAHLPVTTPRPPTLGGEMRNSGEVNVSPLKTSGAHISLK